jgi:hypothetical protein
VTETSTDEKTSERFARKRGIGFPVVPLGEAVNVVRKVGRQSNEVPISAIAHHLGHETTNSGSFKRNLAAFRDWRLITGSGERVVLTDLGQRIAHPTGSDEELEDYQEAFRNCGIFLKVYEDTAKDAPYALQSIANMAIRYGVSPVSKDRFARSFTESAVTAGFAELNGDKVTFGQPDRGEEEPPDSDQGEENRDERSPGQTPPPPPPSQAIPALVHQVWSFTGGRVVLEIHSDRPLPPHAYAKVAGVVSEAQSLAELLSMENDDLVVDDEPGVE